jgi:hypothetical protein
VARDSRNAFTPQEFCPQQIWRTEQTATAEHVGVSSHWIATLIDPPTEEKVASKIARNRSNSYAGTDFVPREPCEIVLLTVGHTIVTCVFSGRYAQNDQKRRPIT